MKKKIINKEKERKNQYVLYKTTKNDKKNKYFNKTS